MVYLIYQVITLKTRPCARCQPKRIHDTPRVQYAIINTKFIVVSESRATNRPTTQRKPCARVLNTFKRAWNRIQLKPLMYIVFYKQRLVILVWVVFEHFWVCSQLIFGSSFTSSPNHRKAKPQSRQSLRKQQTRKPPVLTACSFWSFGIDELSMHQIRLESVWDRRAGNFRILGTSWKRPSLLKSSCNSLCPQLAAVAVISNTFQILILVLNDT